MMSKILAVYAKILIFIIAVLMMVLLISVALQILGRYVPFIPRFLWTDEVARYTLVWVVFLGAIIGVRENKHFYVDFLPKNMSNTAETIVKVIYYLLMYLVAFIFVRYGYRFFIGGYGQHSQIIGFNLGLVYVTVPLAGCSWGIFLTENLYHDFFQLHNLLRRKEHKP